MWHDWEQGNKVVREIGSILQDTARTAEAAGPDDIIQRRQGEPDYFLPQFL